MVGDGVNDAQAGNCKCRNRNWCRSRCGNISLVRSNPRDVVGTIKLSRATFRKMVQNFVWATSYNLVAIPVAGGLFVR